MTRTEIVARDAVLAAVDRLVEHQLGNAWTFGAHCALKHAMLDIIDKEQE